MITLTPMQDKAIRHIEKHDESTIKGPIRSGKTVAILSYIMSRCHENLEIGISLGKLSIDEIFSNEIFSMSNLYRIECESIEDEQCMMVGNSRIWFLNEDNIDNFEPCTFDITVNCVGVKSKKAIREKTMCWSCIIDVNFEPNVFDFGQDNNNDYLPEGYRSLIEQTERKFTDEAIHESMKRFALSHGQSNDKNARVIAPRMHQERIYPKIDTMPLINSLAEQTAKTFTDEAIESISRSFRIPKKFL